MSLTSVTLSNVVKKQYAFKMKSFMGVFTSLVVMQILAIIFSLNGVASSGGSINGNVVHVQYYSADTVIAFTMLWAFINAIIITTKAYREDDFAFVTNRLSSNLSNIAFLVTASLIGAITAILSSFLLKVILYFVFQLESTINAGAYFDSIEFVAGVVTTFLFVLLFSSIGYVIGSIVQTNKLFLFIIPVLFFGMLVPVSRNGYNIMIYSFNFYFQEASFVFTVLKVFITVIVLFAAAIALMNRKEVRK
ncbi:hypothetical protein ACFSTA_09835 [Ornithinibacillus salinisoli]|uniref:ABC transporter permease n=1 Tax=Ornithinibacillus salinisoli TaxID=1848459 RepID=A0ABW4VYE2_9BACI